MQLRYRNAGHLLVSYCTNLSRGGLFVPSADPLPPGTRIGLDLDLPGENGKLRVEAEVRWIRQFDAPEGPAGMGLAFEDIDRLMGDRIDAIVSSFVPLQVALVGEDNPVRTHVAAQVRSLVSCETTLYGPADVEVDDLRALDLVVIDVGRDTTAGLALLDALSSLNAPPPRVALCDAANSMLRSRATGLARVVTTPVDAEELRTAILETVAQVQGTLR